MTMLKPSQSHSGGVIVKPYTGNIAQELQFLSGEDRKKNQPHLRLGSPWQPSKKPTPFKDWVAHGNPVKNSYGRHSSLCFSFAELLSF